MVHVYIIKPPHTMLKRHGSSAELLSHTTLKRHRWSVELLPHDVVELILERLEVKFLLRFRSVSKKWKSTVDSQRFQERHMIRRKQSRDPDVRYVSVEDVEESQSRSIVLESSVICTVKFPSSNTIVSRGSCEGLVCLYCLYTPSMVINPATGWHESFPLSNIQQVMASRYKKEDFDFQRPNLGFGKDKFSGKFKPVWLYNSSEFGLDDVTCCEVYDFNTKTWRYVFPASPCRLLPHHVPVYHDGSLYWFTDSEETKIVSFDLHTEIFEVISKAPFAHAHHPRSITMCVLDNRLCVSVKDWPNQVIWSFHSSGNKTWKKMCSIDVEKTSFWFGEYDFFGISPVGALLPVAILGKNKLLLHAREYLQPLVVHDLQTKSYELLFKPATEGICVSYCQSLFSATSN